jgi:hypothetical protein
VEEYNLRQIFEQILSISKDIEEFTMEELWKWAKFYGTNKHLNNLFVMHEQSGVPIEGRKEIFNEQSIKGQYLLFDFIGHLPEFDIKQYNSFEELIETIVSINGILNRFTTLQIPIINGEAKDILFVLKYKNKTSFENNIEEEAIEKIRNEIIKICK